MAQALGIRWAAALLLLTLFANPTQYSYLSWVSGGLQEDLPLKVLAGLLLLVAFVIYARATVRSIGYAGIGLVIAIIVALGWFLWSVGIISFENRTINFWLLLIAGSFVMGVGLSWSIIRRRLSGQLDVDDVEQVDP